MTGSRKESRQRKRKHERKIEQNWSGSGRRKTLQCIEDATVERHQSDQQQVRKRDAGEFDRERKSSGVARKARRQHIDHGRREYQRDRQQYDLAREQQREDAVRELSGARGATLLPDARIGRHKGGVEGPFGEYGAEMVGQAQRDKKGVGNRAGAQHGGQNNVANEAADTRQQRKAADGQNAVNHRGSSLLPRKITAKLIALRFTPRLR